MRELTDQLVCREECHVHPAEEASAVFFRIMPALPALHAAG